MTSQSTKRVVVSLALIGLCVAYLAWLQALPNLPAALGQMSALKLAGVVIALSLSLFLAGQRLRYASRDFGFPLRYRDAMVATSLGGIAGYFVFQIVGQVAGRGAALRRAGVSVDTIAVVTLYERAVATGVLAAAAAIGALYLFGRVTLDVQSGGAGLLMVVMGLSVTMAAVAFFAWRDLILAYVVPLLRWTILARIARLAGFTVLIQACTLVAYVLAVEQFENSVPLLDLIAACSIVMFAAAIPISFSGWGVRELSAIAALGVLGIPSHYALIASITIGVVSLAVLLAIAYWAAVFAWRPGEAVELDTDALAARRPDKDVARGILALGVPLLIFFQIQVPLDRGFVNVSPADLLAMLCGLLILFDFAKRPRALPSGITAFALAGSLVFVGSYVYGIVSFGHTEWATTRFIGWFVLLSYGVAGGTLVRWMQVGGADRLAMTLVTACAAIIVFSVVVQVVAPSLGRLQGFAGNPNAFSFQILMCIAVGFALLRDSRHWVSIAAILLAGLILAESRAGFITMAGLIVAFVVLCPGNSKRLTKAIFIGVALALLVILAPGIKGALFSGAAFSLTERTVAQVTAYDLERWRTLNEGFQLFLNYPLFGNGLGYYYQHETGAEGAPLVIHSVPVWILAEFGLIGAVVGIAFAAAILRRARELGFNNGVFLVLFIGAVFGVFGLAHDVFYQRSFWLLLGAAIAMMPYRNGSPNAGPA